MKDVLIISFLIISIILLIISIIKKHKFLEIDNNTIEKNKKIKEENDKLYKDNENLLEKQKLINVIYNEKQEDLKKVENIIENMNAAAHEAFVQYQESLDQEYKNIEKEHDHAIDGLRIAYDNLQDILMFKIKQTQADLDKITATRAAAMEAQLKEQEIKNKLSFYCPQVPEDELKDAKTLRDIEYKLNNPRVLRMLIWQTYYQKPMNQVCANVLGGASASTCGIYKITNQKTDLIYIGQAVDISTRWKNHAKAGLGIDTPANNKLYKAMIQDGLENFSFELIEECTREQLDEKERFYIKFYQSDQYGYNSNQGINK